MSEDAQRATSTMIHTHQAIHPITVHIIALTPPNLRKPAKYVVIKALPSGERAGPTACNLACNPLAPR